MSLVGQLRLQLGCVLVAALGAACSDSGSTAAKTACAGGVAVQSGAMCLFTGAITDGEHACPPELPYRYSGDGWWLCSDRDDLDTAAIDAAVREGGVDASDDGSTDDASPVGCRTDAECAAGQVCVANACAVADGTTDDGTTDDGTTDDGTTDDGRGCVTDADCPLREVCMANVCGVPDGGPDDGTTDDGTTDDGNGCRTDAECAVGQVCMAYRCVVGDGGPDDGSTDDGSTDDGCIDRDGDGRCDAGATFPTPFLGPCLVDEDGDGSCAGLDADDSDPSIRDIGLWTSDRGGTDLVLCAGSEDAWARIGAEGPGVLSYDQCVGVDVCLLDPGIFEGLADPAPVLARIEELCAGRSTGYAWTDNNFSGAEAVCLPSDGGGHGPAFCWYELTPCVDGSGALIECPASSSDGCRDDNRDGVCD